MTRQYTTKSGEMPVVFAVVAGVVVAVVVRPIDRVLAMARRRDTLVGVVLENVGENVKTFFVRF